MATYKLGAHGEKIRVLDSNPLSSYTNIEADHMRLCMRATSVEDFMSRASGADMPEGAAEMAAAIRLCAVTEIFITVLEYLAS